MFTEMGCKDKGEKMYFLKWGVTLVVSQSLIAEMGCKNKGEIGYMCRNGVWFRIKLQKISEPKAQFT